MNLESILQDYGKEQNIGKLQLDASGLCNLLVNETQIVTFEQSLSDEGFYVYSAIGAVPVGKELEYGQMALKGNLFGKETGRSSIGYVEQTRTLVLFEYFDNNGLKYMHFNERFNEFLQHLFYWKLKIQLPSKNLEQKPQVEDKNKKVFYV
jgi:Tir chaperone protein (CesT) family